VFGWRITEKILAQLLGLTVSRLQTFANALFSASAADPALRFKRVLTDFSFTFAGLRTPAYGQLFLATAGLLVILLTDVKI